MNLETTKIRVKSHYVAGFFAVALVTLVFHLINKDGRIRGERKLQKEHLPARNEERKMGHEEEGRIAVNDIVSTCNLFSGRWVFDNVSYPLYKEENCSFLLTSYACQKYGRKDAKYQSWIWQPHDCDLPRFNGTKLLEKIRGKRLVFVGDSLSKNQWISMLCLIESSLRQSSQKSVIRNENLYIFRANEYNTTIEFYWSPLLVESNCDDPSYHLIRDRVVRVAGIEKHAKHWTDADILIFDAFMWWQEPTTTILWGSFGSSDAIYKKVSMRLRLYEMVLTTWSEWLEININRTKTKLFFLSPSPYHYAIRGEDTQQHCYNKSEPDFKEVYWGSAIDHNMMNIAKSMIQKLETRGIHVKYLNITYLSKYRKDAHPSIHKKFYHRLSEEQLENPLTYADCTHWCLPGVPDVWNEILYSYIIKSL